MPFCYRSAVVCVMWLLLERHGVMFNGKELACHAHDLMVSNMKALKHLLRYVQHTTVGGILEVVTDAG
eukprot:8390986-Heterocapsa_arctica.AAC.1